MYIWLISYNIKLILIFKNHFKTSFFFQIILLYGKMWNITIKAETKNGRNIKLKNMQKTHIQCKQ